ncbi:MAG: DUF4040 domain-containing protein [Gammaproteobacteria bacterium]|nr:DUF4040 domain-containing protein [Gammaproteobacteria bacterium]
MESVVDLALLGLLAVTAFGVLHLRNLVAVVMLMGIYSFLSAALFVVLDAVDVAFTEVAVGAGVSTILALGTLALVGTRQKRHAKSPVIPLLIVLVTGGMLVYGTYDLPRWGQPDNPVHGHVAPEYLEMHVPLAGEEGEVLEVHIPNIVTTVLASYRGYDTLGETTVVFAAMVGVLTLFVGSRRPRRARGSPADDDGEGGAP